MSGAYAGRLTSPRRNLLIRRGWIALTSAISSVDGVIRLSDGYKMWLQHYRHIQPCFCLKSVTRRHYGSYYETKLRF